MQKGNVTSVKIGGSRRGVVGRGERPGEVCGLEGGGVAGRACVACRGEGWLGGRVWLGERVWLGKD